MLPEVEENNLVHQEILHDSVPTIPSAAIVEQEMEDELDLVEEVTADEIPDSLEEDEDLELDDDIGEDDGEMSVCSACGQSFALSFLVEVDSKLYCALCEPESSDVDAEDDEENEGGESVVDDDDFLAFAEDADLADEEAEETSENLEICAGCGESLHPQFLEPFEGKQYCALCYPEDAEENLRLSDEVEPGNEETVEADESEPATALMDDGFESDEPDVALEDEIDEDEELDEEGFPQKACSVCGDKFHIDFLQEIDSKLYCGVCQPVVIETVPTDVMAASALSSDSENGEDEFENTEGVEEVQDRAPDFTVGDTLREAWEKTRGVKAAVWGGVFAMYLILFGISFAGFYGTQSMTGSDPRTVISINGGLQIFTSWLSMLMTGGLMLIGVRRVLEQRVSWKMVFAAFSSKKVLSVTIATVLQILLIAIGFVLLVLPGIYLTVGYALTLPLILDKGLGPWEALETSRKAIHKKWWTVLGMYLVMMLLYMVSMVPLGLGLIWTVPMFLVLIGVLYARLFGYSATVEAEEAVEEDEVDDADNEEEIEELEEESEESL
jgi:formylmethanofuran dehydrogenase subunit E